MSQKTPPKSLYVKIETYNPENKQIGERVVDIYHPGTSKWLQKHSWWAAHHNNIIEIRNADAGEVQAHLAEVEKAAATVQAA